MEPKTYIIEFLSNEWIRNSIFTFLGILIYLFIGKRLSPKTSLHYAKLISVVLITTTVMGHFRNIMNGYWNISDNLPFHLCGISNLIACFILFIPKNNRLFEFLYYAGILGAIQALLTPQINNFDGSSYEYFEYYFSHAGILLLPIYMFKNLDYRLTSFSWLKIVLYLNILVIIVMPLNFIIDSNYMYLAHKPNVNNPFVIGEWPYYILFWEIIVVVFTYLLYVISTGKKV
ncbi:MAG: TIGR02206 family membrane protein [Flavobacteriaceae bacterium]